MAIDPFLLIPSAVLSDVILPYYEGGYPSDSFSKPRITHFFELMSDLMKAVSRDASDSLGTNLLDIPAIFQEHNNTNQPPMLWRSGYSFSYLRVMLTENSLLLNWPMFSRFSCAYIISITRPTKVCYLELNVIQPFLTYISQKPHYCERIIMQKNVR